MPRNLITGGAGFIGSHLVEHLLGQGDQVIAADDFSTGRRSNVASFLGHPHFSLVTGDIREPALCERLVRDCDRIFHLAATVGVRLAIERPTSALINNITGTANVLESASRHRKPLLVTSTSEVYGKGTQHLFSENDDRVVGPPDKTRWAYAASKAVDEFLALAYFAERKLPVVVTRLFNVVGPRQTGCYGMVIPTFVRQALACAPLTVFGDGSQTRCFSHVLDVVPALVELLSRPEAFGQVYNVGTQEEVTIRTLAERVVELSGSPSEIRFVPYDDAYPSGFEDIPRRVPDLTRIRTLIGFDPQRSLDDAIRDVIEDLRATPDKRA